MIWCLWFVLNAGDFLNSVVIRYLITWFCCILYWLFSVLAFVMVLLLRELLCLISYSCVGYIVLFGGGAVYLMLVFGDCLHIDGLV